MKRQFDALPIASLRALSKAFVEKTYLPAETPNVDFLIRQQQLELQALVQRHQREQQQLFGGERV